MLRMMDDVVVILMRNNSLICGVTVRTYDIPYCSSLLDEVIFEEIEWRYNTGKGEKVACSLRLARRLFFDSLLLQQDIATRTIRRIPVYSR
jgi:hypothetical protein